MGLDIYKYKVTTESAETTTTLTVDGKYDDVEDERLASHFANFVQEKEEAYVDEKATLRNHHLDHTRWSFSGGQGINQEGYYVTATDGENYVDIYENHMEWQHLPTTYLNITEVAYQRGGLKEGWRKGLANTFGIEDDFIYIIGSDQWNRLKDYCEEGSPLLSWTLADDEYIWLWY